MRFLAIRGTFEVKMAPQPADSEASSLIGRLLLDKTYHGALEATSQGRCWGSGPGSAGTHNDEAHSDLESLVLWNRYTTGHSARETQVSNTMHWASARQCSW
jgi:hypothetical protein